MIKTDELMSLQLSGSEIYRMSDIPVFAFRSANITCINQSHWYAPMDEVQ